ncbi:hypothetical protein Cni_G08584 [Canna indica]|uniref:Uncharacterized protein n=1 Tax=Canna indica TaxID=4628 RepID=A0AAQ3K348_9LILI|nr:hypothetical protein Cni_G08584 [Canna indica]
MAAAEARAAWQRTVNRCLVQEDAKRAPKLACCPSSTPQNDPNNGIAPSTQDYPVLNFMPLNRNAMKNILSPETKWWLQLQPNFGYQKDFICEQTSSFEIEVDEKDTETTAPKTKLDEESLPVDSIDMVLKKEESFLESHCVVSTAFMKCGSETMVKDINITNSSLQHSVKQKIDMVDSLIKEEQLLDFKSVDRIITKKPEKYCFNLATPWSGTNKSEPWWRIADQDELSLLVAQKSMEHIENCDLPKPTQIVNVATGPLSSPQNLDTHGTFKSSFGRKPTAGICNVHECLNNTYYTSSGGSNDKNFSSGRAGFVLHDSEKLQSFSRVPKNEQPETNQRSKNDPTRVQLLEALCHSQTRARKAEMAAQKAYDEKEHIIKLLFREASHLFAYKQWLQMLQLERLCLQLKIKNDHSIPVLPWMPLEEKLFSKDKVASKGRKRHKCKICKYTFLFALGLGLVGAGLLFGWTIGWLFPS